MGVGLAALDGVGAFVAKHILAEVRVHLDDIVWRADFIRTGGNALVDLRRQLVHLRDELGQLRAGLLLLREVFSRLLAERDVVFDSAADVPDEDQPVIERFVDLGHALLLLLVGVDGRKSVAHTASCLTTVFFFLPFEVKQVFAGTDAERVAHDIDDGEGVLRRGGDTVDRVDKGGAGELELLAIDRLQEAAPVESDQAG